LVVWYCSRECQLAHFKTLKKDCKVWPSCVKTRQLLLHLPRVCEVSITSVCTMVSQATQRLRTILLLRLVYNGMTMRTMMKMSSTFILHSE
jgi:hypothetical protein